MRSCEHYQAQMLEHLFGLLEADDSLALIEHAGQCEDCRAALGQADGNRKLLAVASKAEFPAVRFQVPSAEPAVLKLPKRPVASPSLPNMAKRWGIAAAIVIALGSIGVPTGRYVADYREQRDAVETASANLDKVVDGERQLIDDREKARANAFETRKRAESQHDILVTAQEKELTEIKDEERRQQMYLVVTGHDTIREGGSNKYRIETKNMKGEQEKARLDIKLKDLSNGQVVHECKDVESTGNYLYSVPVDIPQKASNQLALEVAARSENGSQKGALTENLSLARSVYVTHLVTDKPMYQPGETVYFRSLTLDRHTLKPAGENFQVIFTVVNSQGKEVAVFENAAGDKKGKSTQLARTPRAFNSVASGKGGGNNYGVANGVGNYYGVGNNKTPPTNSAANNAADRNNAANNGTPYNASLVAPQAPVPTAEGVPGIAAGEFTIPEEQEGGEYTLIIKEAGEKFPTERRKFLINVYQKPRLNKQLNFNAPSYGAGDVVVANCRATRAEGGLPLVANVTATIRIDGNSYTAKGQRSPNGEPALRRTTDANGEIAIEFKLPADIQRGEASLAVEFSDGANFEPIVRSIPIVLKKVQIEFFPEGGDLVAGVPNRVYFQARTLLDKPANVKGVIVDGSGKVVAPAETLNDGQAPGINQGMGLFQLTPVAGQKYEMQIRAPDGITGKFLLPPTVADGVVLRVLKGVTSDGQGLPVTVTSTKDRTLVVGAYCRGTLLNFQTVQVLKGQPTVVRLEPTRGFGGVCRITVFEQQGDRDQMLRPLAERLVYRLPAARLNLSVRADKKGYAPGEKVTLHLSAATETGQPMPTVVMVGVVDKSVLTMADEKTWRSMPTHFLLTSEVRRADDLEYADVLLSDHPRAAEALDLLLGTQGWRRFLESDPARFEGESRRAKDQLCRADMDRLRVMTGTMTLAKGEQEKSFDTRKLRHERVVAKFTPLFEQVEVQMDGADDALAAANDPATFEQRRNDLHNQAESAQSAYQAAFARLKDYEEFNALLRHWAILGLGFVLLAGGIGLLVTLGRRLPYVLPVYGVGLATLGLLAIVLVGSYLLDAQSPRESPVAALSPAALTSVDEVDRGGLGAGDVDGLRPNDGARPQPGKGERDELEKQAEHKHPAVPKPNVEMALALQMQQQDGVGPQKKEMQPVAEAKRAAGKADARDQAAANRRQVALRETAALRNLQVEALKKSKQVMPVDFDKAEQLGFAGALYDERQNARPTIVREYAHRRTADQGFDLRSDFAETLYWHPVLVLANGKADVSFDLCDSETTFQVLVAGHTADGRLGSVTSDLNVSKPFSLDAKLPTQVTANDVIDIPVVVNNKSSDARRVHLSVLLSNMEFTASSPGASQVELTVGPRQPTRTFFQVRPTVRQGEGSVTIRATSEPFGADAIQCKVKIVPEGFATTEAHSDLLEGPAQVEVNLPREWVPSTLKVELAVYPSTLTDLQKGLESLLREPNGCFEQTSSSNYPNLLILQYIQQGGQANPAVAEQAKRLLDTGYLKLIAFECQKAGTDKREGYEWFGGTAPAHEALTAYGLMEFRDMLGVGQQVDKQMIERTRKFLLSRKDGSGGFQRNARALDSFGAAPENITNAYIVWAITESDPAGKDDIQRELDALVKQSKDSTDPYFLALVANSLLNRAQPETARSILQKLAELQKPEGMLPGATTSITRSGGRDLLIETTALAMLSWLKANHPDYLPNINAAVKWIGQQRGGYGGFGSTQSTILALKALIAFSRSKSNKPLEPGTVTLIVNGTRIDSREVSQSMKPFTVDKAETVFKPGKNEVQIEMTGKNQLPFTLTCSYNALAPKSAAVCPVRLNAALAKRNVQDGDTVPLNVKVENTTDQGQGMAVAIIGIPAGLNLPEDMEQLKNLARLGNGGTEPGVISAWEIKGRELVLYWRQLAPKQKIEFNLDLICRVPGEYRGPASRAYLYYNADHKHWIEPIQASIAPK